MYDGLHQTPPVTPKVMPQLRDKADVRIIPFDYVASFQLTGSPGKLIEDVINISVEGTFIALAVGYGLAADTAVPLELIPKLEPTNGNDVSDRQLQYEDLSQKTLADMTLANVPNYALMDGFRFNPDLERFAFRIQLESPEGKLDEDLPVDLANEKGLFQWIRDVKSFNFLYNFVDTGSGRELQNAPIHNVAGLGKSNGERPFRMLAKPLAFLPRSTVRIQVEEQSAHVKGSLFIVLHGYKILGAAGAAEEHLRAMYQKAMQRFGPQAAARKMISKVEQRVIPSSRLVPFDYVATVSLTGRKRNIVEEEIPINVEGGFVATSIGYSLAVNDPEIKIIQGDSDKLFNLAEIELSQFPPTALKDGFRIKPEFLRIAFPNGQLAVNVPAKTVNLLFEPLNLPQNINFLYSIADTGTGRDWQNEPILNIAGLGIADGDRPFRNLAWPMHFLPRSTIRLRVEEIFGRGKLFVVFQGYKVLGAI